MKTAKIRPSRFWYGIPIIIFICGITIFVFLLVNLVLKTTDGIQQILVPGKNELSLTKSGKYTVFYEYRSVVNGKIFSANEDISGLECKLKDKSTDQFINLVSPFINSNYNFGSRAGYSVFEFTISTPGIYELSAQYENNKEGEKVVFAVGQGIVEKMIAAIFGGIIVLFLTTASSVGIFVIVLLKRKSSIDKSKKIQEN